MWNNVNVKERTEQELLPPVTETEHVHILMYKELCRMFGKGCCRLTGWFVALKEVVKV